MAPGLTRTSTPHAHAGHGPHGGDIVELGSDQYHAELVHDDATGGVTIYVLDATAKRAAPIDAELVRVNVQHDGNAEQFTLSASPEENDPEGTSSRFITPERELAEDLDHGDIRGQLVVMISGKQYRGDVVHDHHGHDHDDHDDHHDHGHDHHDHGEESVAPNTCSNPRSCCPIVPALVGCECGPRRRVFPPAGARGRPFTAAIKRRWRPSVPPGGSHRPRFFRRTWRKGPVGVQVFL